MARSREGMSNGDMGERSNATDEPQVFGAEASFDDMGKGMDQGDAGNMQDKMTEKAGEYGRMAQDKAGEYGRVAQENIEKGKGVAAESMGRLATQVRERTATSEGMAATAGETVASTMEGTAAYLREHEVADIWGDMERYAREHPMQAVAGAVVAGFLIGRMIK